MAVLVEYDRRGGDYRLKQESYVILISHVRFIPPTTYSRRHRGLPSPYSRPLGHSSVHSPSSHAIANPTSGTFSGSYRATDTRSPSRLVQQILPSSPLVVSDIHETYRERSTSYVIPRRNERTPLLPYADRASPSDAGTGPSPAALSAVILSVLCCLGALGYGGFRLFFLGKSVWNTLLARVLQLAR